MTSQNIVRWGLFVLGFGITVIFLLEDLADYAFVKMGFFVWLPGVGFLLLLLAGHRFMPYAQWGALLGWGKRIHKSTAYWIAPLLLGAFGYYHQHWDMGMVCLLAAGGVWYRKMQSKLEE